MTGSSAKQRVYILSNPAKPEAGEALNTLRKFAEGRCDVVGADLGLDVSKAIEADAQRLIVLGGDGTLIGVARSLGAAQIPIIGVNFGKLGFLAEFSMQDLTSCFDRAIADDTTVRHRTMLEVSVKRDGKVCNTSLAVNDCVIQAGPPFRIIRLGISINDEHLTDVGGDGLIVCTPSGSTAHNLSAGGPIMQTGVDAIGLTPLCAHSLTHRPLVIECDSVIDILASDTNAGTTAIIDGQVSYALTQGDHVEIRRFKSDFLLVHCPLTPDWHNLVTKLHWGQQPNYAQ